jgi:hypothetical protein
VKGESERKKSWADWGSRFTACVEGFQSLGEKIEWYSAELIELPPNHPFDELTAG